MLTPCLGREHVLQQLEAALRAARWVTVVGPPGSGKTLVVRHAAAAHENPTWVRARGLRSTDAVLDACLDALGTGSAPGDSRTGTLSRALDGTDTLLVVDGVEVDGDTLGPVIQELVETTSDARIVVTSLTLGGQPAERVVRVGALPLPGPHEPLRGPALDLLQGRVEQAGGHPLDLEKHDADLRRLLRATGGLPLLLEQVAVQIALVGISNVTPPGSLADTVLASYELLDEDHRRCFRRVAQLPAPASIDVVAEVTEVDPERASRLVASLVRRSLMEVLPDGRFDMLRPIRECGRALGEADEPALVQRALLRWADRVAPHHVNLGAADAPWLVDLPAMRTAVLSACDDPGTRDTGYQLANRIFSSLYTSMRARDAVEILEGALNSGDGPAEIGAQVARRAGIAASEVRGTYEGLWLLDRADQHAVDAPEPSAELAKNASIRAEMHLDAGDLTQAELEARRAIELDGPGGSIVRQATRTIVDVLVSRGDFQAATREAATILAGTQANDERWITLSARTLLGEIALEQGRPAEAAAVFSAVVQEARELAEDRVALLAETLLRDLDPDYNALDVDRDSLPWAVRLPVLAQDARDLFAADDVDRAAGLAADVVALADSSRLGRTAVEARLMLGRALLLQDDADQAATTFLAALERGAEMPMPLRVADALDGLAEVARTRGVDRDSRRLAATAAALRAPRQAVRWGYAARFPTPAAASPPRDWVKDGELTDAGVHAVARIFSPGAEQMESPLDLLTAAERQVAERVADGLTSKRIAEELFVSPRTVDAHLTHIYRKLDINTRAKLAAIVTDHR